MIRGQQIRQLIENGGQRNPIAATRHLLEGLGLIDQNGRNVEQVNGSQSWAHVLETRQGKNANFDGKGYEPQEVSLLEMAHAYLGDNWASKMQNCPYLMPREELLLRESQAAHMFEAGSPVAPGDFINVSALTAAITGLYEVGMMQGFNRPDLTFVDRIAPAEPTKTFGGKKKIGAGPMSANAEKRLPGNPTAEAGLDEKYMTTPETQESALATKLLYETIYLDLAGSVQKEAMDVGFRVRRRKATRIIDVMIGVTSYLYNFNGSTHAGYIASGYYDNDFSNELVHENQIENVLLKFRDMVDPITGERVLLSPNMVVLDQAKRRTWNAIAGQNAEQTQYRDVYTSDPQNIRSAAPAYKGQFEVIDSPLIYERLLAADGLGLSATNAKKYWWMADTNGDSPILYAENWPFRVQQATPSNMEMISRGIALYIKADERGEPYWNEPRRIVRSKN